MMDDVIGWFYSRPSRLMALGAFLIESGGLLLLGGMAVRVMTAGMSAIHTITGQAPHDVTLSDIVLSSWTSVVPEGPLGFGFAVLLIAVGAWARYIGRHIYRFVEG